MLCIPVERKMGDWGLFRRWARLEKRRGLPDAGCGREIEGELRWEKVLRGVRNFFELEKGQWGK